MSIFGEDGRPDKWGGRELETPSGTISWNADLTDLDGNGTELAFIGEIELAFTYWEEVAGVDFVQTSGSDADIFLEAARLEDIAPETQNIEDADGLARWWVSPGDRLTPPSGLDRITEVDIFFDTDRAWELESAFFRVALHEIGHSIGIRHIADETQVMNPRVFVDELGEQDIAAAQSLYGPPIPDELPAIDEEEPPSTANEDVVESSGDSGVNAGLLFGLLAALFAFVFGGPSGAAGAVVVAGSDGAGDEPEPTSLPDLDDDDFLPLIDVEQHLVFLGEDGLYHTHDCGCSTCCGHDPEGSEESVFV